MRISQKLSNNTAIKVFQSNTLFKNVFFQGYWKDWELQEDTDGMFLKLSL